VNWWSAYSVPLVWIDWSQAETGNAPHSISGSSYAWDRVSVIGASNGTTSALDYAVWSSTRPDALKVSALVFLTGGKCTDSQHSFA
jgi:hypothetical protein